MISGKKKCFKIITSDHLKNNNLLTAGEIISCYIQNPLMKKLCLSKQNIIISAKTFFASTTIKRKAA